MIRIKFHFICLLVVTSLFSTAFAKDTIDIAAIYALTGAAVEGNAISIQGVRHGVNEINKQGGVLGRRINMLILDNLSTPLGSDAAAEQAVKKSVVAIIGPQWSSHAIAVARVAQAAEIPMITDFATNPKVTKIGDHVFRVCFTDDFQGAIMARFARKDVKAATAVLYTDVTSDYSLSLSNVFRKNFEESGGKVLLELKYRTRQKIFAELISQTRSAGPDVLFLPGHNEAGLIARQARIAGVSSLPLGGDGWSSQAFLSRGGSELKHGYYCTHWSKQSDSNRSRAFVEKYENAGFFHVGTALGYDAVMLLADAIRRAGSTDKAKIRDAIAGTLDYQGITGKISFNANGDPIKSAVIMEIKNGKPGYFKTIEPEM